MNKRAIAGFLTAPLVVALVVGVITPSDDGLTESLVTGLVWYIGAAALEAVIGVPAFVALHHFKVVNLWSALAVGLLTGAVAFAIIGTPTAVLLKGFVPMATLGGVSAIVFWLIYRPKHVA
jgi:hypothetical protein